MATDRKVLKQHQIEVLQKAAGTPPVDALISWLDLLFEEAKHSLVTLSGDELLRGQGRAQMLLSMKRDLERKPINTQGS